ncbi:hypothetical protein V6N12_050658 [Hibiscus sabdariffa]|uniref:Uncharacterized protein n=1 Tax=Hibiscus sabdariffa TaxID=183260 RepID=A0ABR2GDN3_9ROSI
MLQLHLCKCFNNLPQQDDKGDVSAETTGPAWADIKISAERFVELWLISNANLRLVEDEANNGFSLRLSSPRRMAKESRRVLHSVALADSGLWSGLHQFSYSFCFDLLLLSYVVHLILNLPRQISQVLKSRPIGGFPSDTEVDKGAIHEQCKAISIRSGMLGHDTQKQGAAQ